MAYEEMLQVYPIKKKRQRLKKYGLTLEQYQAMDAAQGSKCAICEKPFVTSGQVDHCHATKRVRGLLCIPCNLGLGHLQEDPTILANAISYVEKHNPFS